ncbi:hypothetical protein O6H91_10G089700 [Diphasiastrum complanatum]|uniref:Uncharacterized protein n=1 Tax=Diphasiastrum complanatum TaxID=34168 RepID=A0ACC2CJF7_DIPCM|nr:hypothetical protein O6H91_10G089700 [Diphasiastrum complanatum]
MKGMSPLRMLMCESPSDGAPEQHSRENPNSSRNVAVSFTSTSLRHPLSSIQVPTEAKSSFHFSNTDRHLRRSKTDPITPRETEKILPRVSASFPHFENVELAVNATPEKHVLSGASESAASLNSRSKHLWFQPQQKQQTYRATDGSNFGSLRRCPSMPNSSLEAFRDEGSNPGQSCIASIKDQWGTPHVEQTGGKILHGRSESVDTHSSSANSTPKRVFSRTFKYGSSLPSSRGGLGLLQSSGFSSEISPQCSSKPQYELEEDLSFWKDHNVQVLIRIRPLQSWEIAIQGYNRCLRQDSSQSLTWTGQPETRFTFDHVAYETITQEKLFNVAGLPMVENCMSGYNSCIFAYGQTGSGKTHTMLGDIEALDQRPSKDRGVIPRVFEYLFVRIKMEEEARKDDHLKYKCKCSFLEIYNEQITDLLDPSSTNLQMREDSTKGVFVDNLSEVEVNSVKDVIQLLLQGASNRKVAATNMNRESSRSHSVFTCVIESKWEVNSVTNTRFGRLHLVDLAGSERISYSGSMACHNRQKGSGAESERLKEAANINKSLSTLGLVIMILVDVANGKQRHVPYRDSKLTFLLQDSLGGNSKTMIIATVSPSNCCSMETLSTLKFAQRAKFIRNNAIVNEDTSGDVLALRQQIQILKEEVNRLRVLEECPSFGGSVTCKVDVTGNLHTQNLDVVLSKCANIAHPFCDSEKCVGTFKELNEKIKALEALVSGSMRREQAAEDVTKRLAAEIERLNCVVQQHEDDAQYTKMMLRFREDKIRRLELIADGIVSGDTYLEEEKNALMEELQLVRSQIDRNPEVTRFAMENIHLMEQLRRFQEFYEGDREVMAEEIANLRNQLVYILDQQNFKYDHRLMDMPQIDIYDKELEEGRKNLSACLDENTKLSSQVLELQRKLTLMEADNDGQQQKNKLIKEHLQHLIHLDELELESGQHLKIISALKEELHEDQDFKLFLHGDLPGKLNASNKELQDGPCLCCKEQEGTLHSAYSKISRNEIKSLQFVFGKEEILLQEEETKHREIEERNMHLCKQHESSVSSIQEEKLMVEALETQPFFSLHEIESLLKQYKQAWSSLGSAEEREQMLKDQMHNLRTELRDRGLGIAVEKQNRCNSIERNSPATFKSSQREWEETKYLNVFLQAEDASKLNMDLKMDVNISEVEAELAETIASMHIELLVLKEQCALLDEQEKTLQVEFAQLMKEHETLKLKCTELSDENVNMTTICERLVQKKDSEMKKLQREWENTVLKLIDYLNEGDRALNEAATEMENIIEQYFAECPEFRRVRPVSSRTADCQESIKKLHESLKKAYALSRKNEEKVRSLTMVSLRGCHLQKQYDTCPAVFEVSSMEGSMTLRPDGLKAENKIGTDNRKTANMIPVANLNVLLQNLETPRPEKMTHREADIETAGESLDVKEPMQKQLSYLEWEFKDCKSKDLKTSSKSASKEASIQSALSKEHFAIHSVPFEALLEQLQAKEIEITAGLSQLEESRLYAVQLEKEKDEMKEQLARQEETLATCKEENQRMRLSLEVANESCNSLYTQMAVQIEKLKITVPQKKAYHKQTILSEFAKANMEELMVHISALEEEIHRKDELLQGLQFDIALLQECRADWMDKAEKARDMIQSLHQERDANAAKLTERDVELSNAEAEHLRDHKAMHFLVEELKSLREKVYLSGKECKQDVDILDLKERCRYLEEELESKHHALQILEAELFDFSALSEKKIADSLEDVLQQLNLITQERDQLKAELVHLNEQLEVAHSLLHERETIAAKAEQVAEISKNCIEEKEAEVKLLERTVDELERTVNALENQVVMVKRETETQRLLKEDVEMELQEVRYQVSKTCMSDRTSADDSREQHVQDDIMRELEQKDMQLLELYEQIDSLRRTLDDKDAQIKKCETQIAELIAAAERQSEEHRQQMKSLDSMIGQVKTDRGNPNLVPPGPKDSEIPATKSRGSVSPIRCMNLQKSLPVSSEVNQELLASWHEIDKLQSIAAARQKEIFKLNTRLAEAESMTHDVIRDLLGVKIDISHYGLLLSQQASHRDTERSGNPTVERLEKVKLYKVKQQLSDLITERQSWLEELECRQSELVAARVTADKLKIYDQRLTEEFEKIKEVCNGQKKLISELQEEVKKLSEQNLQQQIHHHAKIKEENISLRIQIGNLSSNLQRAERRLERLSKELAGYRMEVGKTPYPNFDEEENLRTTLQEAEDNQLQLAKEVTDLCTSIFQAAGISSGREAEPSIALEIIRQLQSRLHSAENELSDIKLKNKLAAERKKLSELQPAYSFLKPTNSTPEFSESDCGCVC